MHALITGGSKGIGRATAERFAAAGFDLWICARGESELLELGTAITAKYPVEVHTSVTDVADADALRQLGAAVSAHWNYLDVLVNNAGLFRMGRMLDEDESNLIDMMNVNVLAPYRLVRAVLPLLRTSEQATVINVGSVAGKQPFLDSGSYSITKYALLGFTHNLREELKSEGIRVSAVLPGATYTASWDGVEVDPERIMRPEAIANAIYSCHTVGPSATVEELLVRPNLGDL